MRKALICILACLMLLSGTIQPCNAATQSDTNIVYFDDGSYLETTLTITQMSRASNSISGKRTRSLYNTNDELQWTFVMNASFTYEYGVSAACTDAVCDTIIENTAWSCKTKSATPNGNIAYAQAEMVRKFLFIPIETFPIDMTITCDVYGNLS